MDNPSYGLSIPKTPRPTNSPSPGHPIAWTSHTMASPILPHGSEWSWHGGCPYPGGHAAVLWLRSLLSERQLEINCWVKSRTLNSPSISTWAAWTGSPPICLRAGCRVVSIIGATFVLLWVFCFSPNYAQTYTKTNSHGTRRYLPGSDRLVPRLALGLIKDPRCHCAGVWACKM